MIKAAVIGATGYAGCELVNILSSHKDVKLSYLASHSYQGKRFSDVYPSFYRKVDSLLMEDELRDYPQDREHKHDSHEWRKSGECSEDRDQKQSSHADEEDAEFCASAQFAFGIFCLHLIFRDGNFAFQGEVQYECRDEY